jgi:phospholipid N-methyltransferase
MTNNNTNHYPENNRKIFFQEFLKHPLQVGSIIPSSRFLERRIVESAGITSANIVVELGPGTGGVTRAILEAMPKEARLLSIEINPQFYGWLSQIKDERFLIHLGSAMDLKEILAQYNLDAPDAVVSGIPFSAMSKSVGKNILESVSSVLAPGGCFVAYQLRDTVATLCRPIMGVEQSRTELLNIPPMRVYQWEKNNAERV